MNHRHIVTIMYWIILPAMLLCIVNSVFASGYSASGEQSLQFSSRRGKYFSWAAPPGWKSSETMNGVTLTSPDNKAAVMNAILLRSQGQSSPLQFLQFMLLRMPGYSKISISASKKMPDQKSGIPGTSWNVIEAELNYTINGAPFHAIWTCGVNNYYGMYDASLSGYQATATMWPTSKLYRSAMANRIAIINPRQIAGNDTLIPVRNNPLDNSGIIASGRLRDESHDRVSKKTREWIMGQERVKDSRTGEVFSMPLSSYDAAAGGYRNPKRPTELLTPTAPGE